MSLYDIPVDTASGDTTTLGTYDDKLLLVVNVASRCGLTPQYGDLQQLQEKYRERGLQVVGFPSNQFNGQEPGTNAEIQEFCVATYGVDFPVFAKVDVNGADQHPVYGELTQVADATGEAGDVAWNFEKYLVAPGGRVIARVRPQESPAADEFVALVEANLPA
ncbi:glutathione peroxidase [Frondihabitans sp. Leaf304]|uniref:glutathione peroxidase n=1 Tax=Frondihabitans sp. Leaf304 TaxID=1736329 RepID=UPI0006F2C0A7|nr:glutathione peroxidase [Frondihabitans sp. Leaf304]KQQ28253.1 glutathione peroxidase [Frondihabitans sp. Leaf304]